MTIYDQISKLSDDQLNQLSLLVSDEKNARLKRKDLPEMLEQEYKLGKPEAIKRYSARCGLRLSEGFEAYRRFVSEDKQIRGIVDSATKQ